MRNDTLPVDTISELFKAIESGDAAAVRELIETDPRLAEARNKDGASALTWAAYYRKQEICDLLLRPGMKLDIFEASILGTNNRVVELTRSDQSVVDRYSSTDGRPSTSRHTSAGPTQSERSSHPERTIGPSRGTATAINPCRPRRPVASALRSTSS